MEHGARAFITLYTDDAGQTMPLYKRTDSEGQMADEPTFYRVVFLLQFQLSSTWCPPDVLNFTCQNSRNCHPSHLEGTGSGWGGELACIGIDQWQQGLVQSKIFCTTST